jgi:hypothetical protein
VLHRPVQERVVGTHTPQGARHDRNITVLGPPAPLPVTGSRHTLDT